MMLCIHCRQTVTVLGDDPQPPADVPTWDRHRSDKTAASGYYGMAGFEF